MVEEAGEAQGQMAVTDEDKDLEGAIQGKREAQREKDKETKARLWAVRKKAYEERLEELQRELRALNEGDHPEFKRQRLVLEARRSRRLATLQRQVVEQVNNLEGLLDYELEDIDAQYDASVVNVKEKLARAVREDVKRLENCRDGVKDTVGGTRSLRSKAKAKADDDFFSMIGGHEGKSRKKMTPANMLLKALDGDEIAADIGLLRGGARAMRGSNKRPHMSMLLHMRDRECRQAVISPVISSRSPRP